jgi:group I intron endonuclease
MSGCGVYKITNIITKEFYIGSSKRLDYRRWGHLHKLRKNKHKNRHLQDSYNQYGEQAFKFEILEITNENVLKQKEQYYLDTLNPSFNICKNANSPAGIKHTEEAKINMRNAHIGKKLSKESIEKRTKKILGSKRSQETVLKMRKSAKTIIVEQYDLKDNFIKEWHSISEAARYYKIKGSHISSCCKNKRKTCCGFKWRYK